MGELSFNTLVLAVGAMAVGSVYVVNWLRLQYREWQMRKQKRIIQSWYTQELRDKYPAP